MGNYRMIMGSMSIILLQDSQMQEEYQRQQHLQLLKKALTLNGYLLKKSKSLLSKYRKRYFIIMGDKLAYFTDHTLKDFRKEFPLTKISNLKLLAETGFSFIYTLSRKEAKEYFFKADTMGNRDQWVKDLGLLLNDVHSQKLFIKTMESERPRVIVKKYSEQIEEEPDIRFVFKKLQLPLLDHKYDEDYIKCRIAGHFNGKQVLFLVSCKSLDKELFDESILTKEHMGALDFNVLYKYNPETRVLSSIIAAEKIREIALEGDTLRINQLRETVSLNDYSLDSFVEKLRMAVSIGGEYRNSQGIALKQNVDYLIELFGQPQSRLKTQHLQLKLEDEFISVKANHKDYKESYAQFKVFSKKLIEKVQDIINALKLKGTDLLELSKMVLRFYQEKIYKLLRTFWSENSETMTVDDLVSMTIISNDFFNIISQYQVDRNKTIIGIRFLRDTYLKKIIAESQSEVRGLTKNDKLFVALENGGSALPTEFVKVLKNKLEILEKTQCHDQVIRESKQLLMEAIVIVLTNQLETKIVLSNNDISLLILLCNDTWNYEWLLQKEFSEFDLVEAANSIAKFRKLITKKLFSKCYAEKDLIPINQYFLDVDVEHYHRVTSKFVSELENMDSQTAAEVNERLSDDFNTYYFKSLVNAADKEIVFINVVKEITDKITSDQSKVQVLFPPTSLPKILSFFSCIKAIFEQKDTEENVKERFVQLKFNIFPDEFRKSDYKSLLSLRGSLSDLDVLISELDAATIDTDLEEKTSESDNDLSFRSFNSFSSSSGVRGRRQTSYKTEAEILLHDDIDFEGYLKKRTVCNEELTSSGQEFVEQYFKLNSEFLLWYKNSNSQDLLDRILLSEVKKVDVSVKNPEEFFLILNNGVRYEFRAGAACSASKWVQKISSSNQQYPLQKSQSLNNLFKQEKLLNLFQSQQNHKHQRGSLLSNHRDHMHSRLVDYDSSQSPIQKKPSRIKKKFTFGRFFGCASLE